MVAEATGGRLIMETKVGLFPPTEVILGVIDGRAEIGFQRIPFVSGTFPLWDFGSLPFFFANNYEYEAALNDPRMVALMEKSFGEYGLVKLLESPSSAQNGIFANQAYDTVDDFQGIKIRTSGVLQTFTLELMGSSPLTIASTELAEALQRGTVDAIATSLGFGLGIGMADVTSYVSLWPVSSSYGGVITANMDAWNELPADLQEILMDVSREMQGQNIYATDVDLKRAISGVRASGLEVITPDKAEIDKAIAISKPVVDKWLEIAGPLGPEILAVISDYGIGGR
jgi:TRAP-type C4-dicarboxylate transport system substrate-binding protein